MTNKMKFLQWADRKLANAEAALQRWDNRFTEKVKHASPCIHCGVLVHGSITDGFYHINEEEFCDLEYMTVKATPQSLFRKGHL